MLFSIVKLCLEYKDLRSSIACNYSCMVHWYCITVPVTPWPQLLSPKEYHRLLQGVTNICHKNKWKFLNLKNGKYTGACTARYPTGRNKCSFTPDQLRCHQQRSIKIRMRVTVLRSVSSQLCHVELADASPCTEARLLNQCMHGKAPLSELTASNISHFFN